jgi:hypothetical protein
MSHTLEYTMIQVCHGTIYIALQYYILLIEYLIAGIILDIALCRLPSYQARTRQNRTNQIKETLGDRRSAETFGVPRD